MEEVLNKFSVLRDERILKSEEYGWVNEEPQVDRYNSKAFLAVSRLILLAFLSFVI